MLNAFHLKMLGNESNSANVVIKTRGYFTITDDQELVRRWTRTESDMPRFKCGRAVRFCIEDVIEYFHIKQQREGK